MSRCSLLEMPSDFADYEWEVTAKGWFPGALLTVAGKQYRLNFYDSARLIQDVESELLRGGVFFEPNLVVVRSVTRAEMELAVRTMVQSDLVASLTPE